MTRRLTPKIAVAVVEYFRDRRESAVLVDGDDHNEPVADAMRSTLDGHIVLNRHIADQARYPAVDVLASVSRLAHHVWSSEKRELVSKMHAMVAP